MERSRRIGMMVSGGAHLGAILWLMLGGLFFSHDLPPPVASAEVSLISSAEFSALAAAAPRALTEAPPQPSPPAAAEDAPAPAPAPDAAAEAQPEAALAPDAATPDAAPDVTDLTPPATVVEDVPPTPPAPPVEEPAAQVLPEVSPQAVPKPAPRVAPTPAEAPEPDAEPAPDAVAERAPDPQADPLPVEPETPAAPPEAGDVLLTEENRDQTEVASAAPLESTRPKSKPAKPKPADPKPAGPAKPAAAPATDSVAEALAEALAGAAADAPAPGTGTAPSGPPMTGGEKDALVVAVKQCWNVGALSTDALRTVVTIGVSMDPSGRPVEGSIRLLGYEGGDETAARGAFDAGRRAILRCARDGYPLPAEKYDQWREVEIVFNPERMRMK